ncbi:MAG: type II toxin-antitoxin system HicA family toxin [Deltaproteobacteria bacterium]|nr:type II toxin-antitoxin system HicA family toxin [Deltaproteobacteria bacterium]
MKRRDLEKQMKLLGWWLLRHGSNHDIWTNGREQEPIPRHNEIAERLAKKIIKMARKNPGNQ